MDVTSLNSNEETSLTEGEPSSGATSTSTKNKKQPEKIGKAISTNLLKKERGIDISRRSELTV